MWQVTGAVSQWVADNWTAEVQLEHPEQGIRIAPASNPSMQLMRVELCDGAAPLFGPRVVDHYVRQNDLVINYEYAQPQMRMQLYWRHEVWRDADGGILAGMRLLLSLQTNRLNSCPLVTVATEVTSQAVDVFDQSMHQTELDKIEHRPPMCVFHDAEQSLAVMVHPTDIVGVEIGQTSATSWRGAYDSVGEHLEKGVIRRVQLGACVFPAGIEPEMAVSVFQQFVNAPLPLTV